MFDSVWASPIMLFIMIMSLLFFFTKFSYIEKSAPLVMY